MQIYSAAGLEERRIRAVSYVKQVPDDDDIVIVEDIDSGLGNTTQATMC